MAIISFWSGSERETGQTLSIAAVATRMAIEHNYKILLIDATFDDDTLERCFWKVARKKDVAKLLNKGKMDISSGAEGLISAVASNKTTPEIIKNYTRAVFKTLDVLCGLKTKIPEEFNKSLMLYKDLLNIADKYYDIVLVDVEKTLKKDTTKALLDASTFIVCNFTQNLKQIEDYMDDLIENPSILKQDKVISLLSNSDDTSKYNMRNVARYIKDKDLVEVPYNKVFSDAASEAGVAQFFIKNTMTKNATGPNALFTSAISNIIKLIDYKLEELKYKY